MSGQLRVPLRGRLEAVGELADRGREPGQFLQVRGRQPVEDALPARCQPEVDDSLVGAIEASRDESRLLGTVDQLDHAVVSEQKGVGELPDGWRPWLGVTTDGEEQLVLLRGDAGRRRLLFAPLEEPAERHPELEQTTIFLVAERGVAHLCDPSNDVAGSVGTTSTRHRSNVEGNLCRVTILFAK